MIQSRSEYRAAQRKISIYNSLGGSKSYLDPLDPKPEFPELKMYVCGLTPQDHSHLGHGLMAVRFDIVRRYLKYRRLNVNFVQNVTDVEDKIIDKVLKTGEDPLAMTGRFTDEFYKCLGELKVLPVDRLTKVTDFIPQIISFIEKLVEKGIAYATSDGSVYFDVRKKTDYGKLSHQNTEMLFESVRKELDKQKHSPLDFALWKRDDNNVLCTKSPWGVGRPGWHIECSVMIYETLGRQIDIHGGGLDLKFPHHENEIAQSEAFTDAPFAGFWMHSGLLNINGQKMSKSLNNFVRLVDGVAKFGPAILRFVIARHHYRSAIDLTEKLFGENINSLLDFHRLFERLPLRDVLTEKELDTPAVKAIMESFEVAMDNDFNTPEALVALEQARNSATQRLDAHKKGASEEVIDQIAVEISVVRALGAHLGLFFDTLAEVEAQGLRLMADITKSVQLTREDLASVIAERTEARAQKNFAKSDEIRNSMAERGVEILDSRGSATWRFSFVSKT